MDKKYLQHCPVAKWFWMRAILVVALLLGIATYFFYDWKIGYPKKNYHYIQYQTFQKARDYFLKGVEMQRSPEQWAQFVAEQPLEYYRDRDSVLHSYQNESWPLLLQDYDKLAAAAAAPKSETPLLWQEFLKKEVQAVEELKTRLEISGDKADRIALEKAIRWDKEIPSAITKKAYEANYRFIIYQTFVEAEETFRAFQAAGKSKEDWAFYSSCRDLAFPIIKSVVPSDKHQEKWPTILADYDRYYALAKEDIESGVEINEPYLWKEYTAENKWGQKPADSIKAQDKIDEQLYFGIGCLVLALLAAGYSLRMKGRFMAVDEKAFYAPGQLEIPFPTIYKIDKRKWDTKGLATIYYEKDGIKGKTRVDGMVYGQFDKAQGEPAQKLFDILMANFKGELVDFASDDEE